MGIRGVSVVFRSIPRMYSLRNTKRRAKESRLRPSISIEVDRGRCKNLLFLYFCPTFQTGKRWTIFSLRVEILATLRSARWEEKVEEGKKRGKWSATRWPDDGGSRGSSPRELMARRPLTLVELRLHQELEWRDSGRIAAIYGSRVANRRRITDPSSFRPQSQFQRQISTPIAFVFAYRYRSLNSTRAK